LRQELRQPRAGAQHDLIGAVLRAVADDLDVTCARIEFHNRFVGLDLRAESGCCLQLRFDAGLRKYISGVGFEITAVAIGDMKCGKPLSQIAIRQ